LVASLTNRRAFCFAREQLVVGVCNKQPATSHEQPAYGTGKTKNRKETPHFINAGRAGVVEHYIVDGAVKSLRAGDARRFDP